MLSNISTALRFARGIGRMFGGRRRRGRVNNPYDLFTTQRSTLRNVGGFQTRNFNGWSRVPPIPSRLQPAKFFPPEMVGGAGALVGKIKSQVPTWWQRIAPHLKNPLVQGAAAGAGGALIGSEMLDWVSTQTGRHQREIVNTENIVSTWVWKGTRYHRLADGRIALQYDDGSWRTWWPRRRRFFRRSPLRFTRWGRPFRGRRPGWG